MQCLQRRQDPYAIRYQTTATVTATRQMQRLQRREDPYAILCQTTGTVTATVTATRQMQRLQRMPSGGVTVATVSHSLRVSCHIDSLPPPQASVVRRVP
jgi:hypothetical protein